MKEELSEQFSKSYKQSLERIAFARSKISNSPFETIEQRKLEEAHSLLKKEDVAANLENKRLFQQLERVENELTRVNEDVEGTSKQILKQNMVGRE